MDYSVYTVPPSNIAAMSITLVICIGLPLGLCIFWKIKSGARLSAFLIGCGTFVVSALILEQLLHAVVLTLTGSLLTDRLWLYALYGGLAAGLFEETGRLLAMRFCMKKSLEKENAVMYGIGHGGVEAILITGLTYASNLLMVLTVNSGGLGAVIGAVDQETGAMLFAQLSQLWELPASLFLLAGVERVSAIILHICLSYLVYKAVKDRKPGFYLLAVFLHFLVDAGTIFLVRAIPVAAMEGILLAVMLVLALGVALDYRRSKGEKHDEQK